MTSTHKKGTGEIVLNVFREVGEGNFLNRICKDATTNEVKYYCQVDAKLQITVHKGDKSGPVIATATQSTDPNHIIDIDLTQSSQTLHLKHVHDIFHGRTYFDVAGKKLHWKGNSALVEDVTGVCLAVYKAKLFEAKNRKLGTLLITKDGLELVDVIVSTALVQQERTDEAEDEDLKLSKVGELAFYKDVIPMS